MENGKEKAIIIALITSRIFSLENTQKSISSINSWKRNRGRAGHGGSGSFIPKER